MNVDIREADLLQPVAELLRTPHVEIESWSVQQLSGGVSEQFVGGLGVYHVEGTAHLAAGEESWSVILKAASGSVGTGSEEPSDWNFWKRETMVYQSGLLRELPGGIVAARCYAIQERPAETTWLWLEHVVESGAKWSLASHAEAARHLGQFNGAYLTGYPLPQAESWMSWGRTRPWVEFAKPWVARSRQFSDTPLARQWFGPYGLERTLGMWESVPQLLQSFERLPICFCHHDAFRRNLLDRRHISGTSETVAIDWAFAGFGRVGEEVGAMVGLNLAHLEVPGNQARELDQLVFAAYVEGLREAGWNGAEQLARLGYAVNAFLMIGILWNLLHLENMQQPEEIQFLEELIGYPADAIIANWAEALPFLLDLAEEACRLADDQLK